MYIKSARFYTDKIKKSFLEMKIVQAERTPKESLLFGEGEERM